MCGGERGSSNSKPKLNPDLRPPSNQPAWQAKGPILEFGWERDPEYHAPLASLSLHGCQMALHPISIPQSIWHPDLQLLSSGP